MTDREKVIKGLKAHGYKDCKHCPYWGTGRGGMSECTQLARDALALLKAQEPRVMTPADVHKIDEQPIIQSDAPRLMTLAELSGIYVEFKNDLIPMSLTHFDLGKIICCMQDGSCRLWSSKPSVEQREDTPWQ